MRTLNALKLRIMVRAFRIGIGNGETIEFNYNWYGPKSIADAYEWATETHEDTYVTSFKWHFC